MLCDDYSLMCIDQSSVTGSEFVCVLGTDSCVLGIAPCVLKVNA